jgi:uncharacterized lipoprotein YddW (UPF0748 family)
LNGADWPKPEFRSNVAAQESSLVAILDVLKKANMNTVLFQVRPRGNAFYRSSSEPWARELTGELGRDPGWDPLRFALQEAHKRGLELHAWFNVYKVWGGSAPPPASKPLHVVRSHPEWARVYHGEWWLDPGIPAVRDYLVGVAMELISKYDIDGIHFDYMRYPAQSFQDEDSYRKFGGGTEKSKWRRENINQFVREIYDRAVRLKPMIKVGSAPIGVYESIPGALMTFNGYSAGHQDSREWLKQGKHDYIAPQIYWYIGNSHKNPDFAALLQDWQKNSYGRHVYAGVGAYKDSISAELPRQIDTTRSMGAGGNIYFRFEHIKNPGIFVDRYKYLSLVPPMPWKDSVPPNPPRNLALVEIWHGTIQLRWETPFAAIDGDSAKQYAIYRSSRSHVDTENPENLIALIPGSSDNYRDNIPLAKSRIFYYVVTALDKGNVESVPSNEVQTSKEEIAETNRERQIAEMTELLVPRVTLTQNYPNPFAKSTLIGYELKDSSLVDLNVCNANGREVRTLAHQVQGPGTYVVLFDASDLTEGKYTLVFKAGSHDEKKTLDILK